MVSSLTNRVRSISEVTKAVAHGQVDKYVDVDVQGEMLDLKETVDMMVKQLRGLAQEVIRMSIEVGTEGKLCGQAVVADVQGVWKVRMFSTVQSLLLLLPYALRIVYWQFRFLQILMDNVNLMATSLTEPMNLTERVRSITAVTKTAAGGELTRKISVDVRKRLNGMTDSLRVFTGGVTRLAREVRTEGRSGGQARVMDVGGT